MKKKIIVITIIFLIAVLLFLFRVYIYNRINISSITKQLNVKDKKQIVLKADYVIDFFNDENPNIRTESLFIYNDISKIIYYTEKDAVFPTLGEDTYYNMKILELDKNDAKIFEKNKSNSNLTFKKADKMKDAELYNLLDKIKNSL